MSGSHAAARQAVDVFIAAVNDRDAKTAQAALAENAQLVFPGPIVFTQVSDFLAWAAARYSSATYAYHAMDLIAGADATVIYGLGQLSGQFNDGTHFEDVRYIDRFVVRDGRIERKEVWSDMADHLRRLGR